MASQGRNVRRPRPQRVGVLRIAAAALLLAAVTGTVALASTVAASAAATHQPISAGAAFNLPSSKGCLKHLQVSVRPVRHLRWVKATISINGKVKRVLTGSALHHSATFKKLPSGRFHVTLTAIAAGHRSATITRAYKACAASKKPTPKPTPTPTPKPTPTPTPIPTPTPTPTPSSVIQPGSYSGYDSTNAFYTLYVSPDGTQIQDVSVSSSYYNRLNCTPGTTLNDASFNIPDIAIASDGSFTGTATQTSVKNGVVSTATYTFTGRFTSLNSSGQEQIAGQVREDVSYNDGVAHTCTTGTNPVSMTRESQGSQAAAPAPAGSYSGYDNADAFYTFYVSPDGTQIQDVSVSSSYYNVLSCAPGTTLNDASFNIPDIAIASNGSFTGTTTQTSVKNGVVLTATYTFTGHFHGLNSSGAERVAGQIREDATYNDGVAHTCTTGTHPVSMTRESQGSQAAAPAPAGSYSGYDNANAFYTFRVSPDGTQIQDVSVSSSYYNVLSCAPGTTLNDASFSIPDIAIASDGSFTGTATQTGVENGAVATFTYTFTGHFHGLNSSGAERVAGQIREDATYNDGVAHSCTTGTQPISMTRTGS